MHYYCLFGSTNRILVRAGILLGQIGIPIWTLPASIFLKSISDRYRPDRIPVGPITSDIDLIRILAGFISYSRRLFFSQICSPLYILYILINELVILKYESVSC